MTSTVMLWASEHLCFGTENATVGMGKNGKTSLENRIISAAYNGAILRHVWTNKKHITSINSLVIDFLPLFLPFLFVFCIE